MAIELKEQSVEDLMGYAGISIAFRVSRVLVPAPDLGPLAFREELAQVPRWKDYDATPGCDPTSWPERFDTASWRVISAWRGSQRAFAIGMVASARSATSPGDCVEALWPRRLLVLRSDCAEADTEKRSRLQQVLAKDLAAFNVGAKRAGVAPIEVSK